jgi:hypothetical protein
MAKLDPKLLASLSELPSTPARSIALRGRPLYDFRQRDRHRVRILPSQITGHPFGLPVSQHCALPGDRTLTCTMTWPDLQLPCALCNALRPLGRRGKKSSLPYLWTRTFTSGIDRHQEEAGVQIIGLPLACDEWISESTRYRVPHGSPYGDITDPVDGRDILIQNPRRTRQRYQTSFALPSPLHEDPEVVARWMNRRHDILALFPSPGPEALAEIAHVAKLVQERLR